METKTLTKTELLNTLYKECGLSREDVYQHQHYTIITRTGIEKIQFAKGISVRYEIIECQKDFVVVKAIGSTKDESVETFGSALYGRKTQVDGKWVDSGSCTTWYVAEMAEKRALSRVVLKLTKAYSMGVFGEDEAEDFARSNPNRQ